jgi:hypothetical protein
MRSSRISLINVFISSSLDSPASITKTPYLRNILLPWAGCVDSVDGFCCKACSVSKSDRTISSGDRSIA